MDRAAIREGMIVYSADGKKLGWLVERDDDTLVVEKGHFFIKDYAIGVEDVARIEGDELHLRLRDDEIEGDRDYDTRGHRFVEGGNPGPAGEILAASEDDEPPSDLHERRRTPDRDAVVVIEEEIILVAQAPDAAQEPPPRPPSTSGRGRDPNSRR